MGDLTTVRWTRFGKDRLYVKDADGAEVAWIDLVTSEVHLAVPERAADVAAIASAHAANATPTAGTPPVEVETAQGVAPEPVLPEVAQPSPVEASFGVLGPPTQELAPPTETIAAMDSGPGWFDLAQNRPGQAARAKAEEELTAMKEKTRVGTWLVRALDVKTDERAWRVGADGEETIGAKLEKLTKDGWYVLHSLPVGKRGSDIDHVVIGPAGVFTVNTKKHPGKKVWVSKNAILVNGHRTDYLRNSRFEGERATKLLTTAVGFPVFVKPVLVFTTGTPIPDVTIKSKPDDVAILDRMDVPRAFKRSTVVLSSEQVERVYSMARRSTTWTS